MREVCFTQERSTSGQLKTDCTLPAQTTSIDHLRRHPRPGAVAPVAGTHIETNLVDEVSIVQFVRPVGAIGDVTAITQRDHRSPIFDATSRRAGRNYPSPRGSRRPGSLTCLAPQGTARDTQSIVTIVTAFVNQSIGHPSQLIDQLGTVPPLLTPAARHEREST